MFKDLPHNTRTMLILEPCSSVLACILSFTSRCTCRATAWMPATLCINGQPHDMAQVDYSAAMNSKTGYTKE